MKDHKQFLINNSRYFISMIEHSSDAILSKKLDGTICSWNKCAEVMFGYLSTEMVGHSVYQIIPLDLHEIEKKISDQLCRGIDVGQYQTKFLSKQGKVLRVSISVSPIKDISGKIIGVTNIIRNTSLSHFTDIKFKNILKVMPDAIMIVDKKGKVLIASESIEKLFGYCSDELNGFQIESLMPERFRKIHLQKKDVFFHAPLAKKMGVGQVIAGLRKDGSEFPIEVNLSPVFFERSMYISCVVRDTSEQKKSYEQICSLLKEVHHRVNNNLQIISSLLHLQSQSISDEYAACLFKDSQLRIKAISLIHEKLYKSENLSKVNLGGYIEELSEFLVHAYKIPNRHINLVTSFADVKVEMDIAIPCGLLIYELLSNVLKHAFSWKCAGKINISLNKEKYWVSLIVSDNGLQVKDAIVFQKFSSLGLKIVQMLARQLLGRFPFKIDKGVKFILVFPVKKESL